MKVYDAYRVPTKVARRLLAADRAAAQPMLAAWRRLCDVLGFRVNRRAPGCTFMVGGRLYPSAWDGEQFRERGMYMTIDENGGRFIPYGVGWGYHELAHAIVRPSRGPSFDPVPPDTRDELLATALGDLMYAAMELDPWFNHVNPSQFTCTIPDDVRADLVPFVERVNGALNMLGKWPIDLTATAWVLVS